MSAISVASEYGRYGAKVITGDGTTATTPETGYAFGSLQFVTAGSLSAVTAPGWSSGIAGKSFVANARIYGLFTSVTPANNVTVIAYNIPHKA